MFLGDWGDSTIIALHENIYPVTDLEKCSDIFIIVCGIFFNHIQEEMDKGNNLPIFIGVESKNALIWEVTFFWGGGVFSRVNIGNKEVN